MTRVSHFKEYHWQQPLAGMLRALDCDQQMARAIADAIREVYGRADALNLNFEEWMTRQTPPAMVGEVEALNREYLERRKAV